MMNVSYILIYLYSKSFPCWGACVVCIMVMCVRYDDVCCVPK
jgi:hypothetical protein